MKALHGFDHRGKYPLVTVGVPTYNGGEKIVKALKSILRQDYPNIELIISDNCSSDNTMEVCMDLGQKNQCVRYFRQPRNIGMMPNFEFVLSQASGDFFMWMSDDDSLEPGILKKYVHFLLHHPGYSLVSGQIKYWIDDRPLFCERDFNFEQRSGMARLLNFYFKVVYGSIFYGLMQTEIAREIPLRNRIGDDWHFIASLAYLGKIKNLDCVGYNKKCGGLSRDFKQYGNAMGATPFAVRFPRIQIAMDAFSNILRESPVYADRHYLTRVVLASFAFCSILINYYGKVYPLILGGKLKRLVGFKTSRSAFRTA